MGMGLLCVHRALQHPNSSLQLDPGPASQLSVPQAEIKEPVLANTPGLRHSLAPAAAEQEQPQHALLKLGKGAERFMGWMCH